MNEKRTMRRSDRLLTDNQAQEILRNSEHGVLATVSEDGQPYGVPLNYAYIDGFIYMHCTNKGGLKIENLRNNDRVSFTVVGGTEVMPEKFGTKYSSVICFGTVEILDEREEKRFGIENIMLKYSSAFKEGGLKYIDTMLNNIYVLRMSISHLTGKARVK